MEILMAGQGALAFAAACLVTLFAGFVKGAVGFAMPLIMIGSFSAFLPPQVALAGLIMPTLVTNLMQALRDGPAAAAGSAWKFRRFLIGTVVFIAISAQFVTAIPRGAFLLLLGVPITAFALVQLSGQPLALRLEHRTRAEWTAGVIGGLYGGISGVWGPPLIVYLLSTGAGREETLRVLGVVFLIGACALLGAHIGSGVVNVQTAAFSTALVVPAVVGLALGLRLGRRLDQARFRWWTQVLLVATGLNLVVSALRG
ncbi:MAG TPA: sulfite exporter TauE/SafE family protein [Paracoccaceae bacterium]|nr:sulfite exporter TauE/SafE family protein [Paracoccaceae bacterium]HMO72333.1 sulfite exporter TauE/SafE family protein [Paracoccaceae bacterium]